MDLFWRVSLYELLRALEGVIQFSIVDGIVQSLFLFDKHDKPIDQANVNDQKEAEGNATSSRDTDSIRGIVDDDIGTAILIDVRKLCLIEQDITTTEIISSLIVE